MGGLTQILEAAVQDVQQWSPASLRVLDQRRWMAQTWVPAGCPGSRPRRNMLRLSDAAQADS